MTVVRELKASQSYTEKSSTFLQLAVLVGEIFRAQPSRKFIHGFQLCGNMFRSWRSGCAGALGSGAFCTCIHESPKVLLVLLHYWKIKIEYPRSKLAVDIGTGELMVLKMDPTPIFQSAVAAGRATVCWRGLGENGVDVYVIKEQWGSVSRPAERTYLQATKDVFDVVPYVTHLDVEFDGELVITRGFIRRVETGAWEKKDEGDGSVDIWDRALNSTLEPSCKRLRALLARLEHRVLIGLNMAGDCKSVTEFASPQELLATLLIYALES